MNEPLKKRVDIAVLHMRAVVLLLWTFIATVQQKRKKSASNLDAQCNHNEAKKRAILAGEAHEKEYELNRNIIKDEIKI